MNDKFITQYGEDDVDRRIRDHAIETFEKYTLSATMEELEKIQAIIEELRAEFYHYKHATNRIIRRLEKKLGV